MRRSADVTVERYTYPHTIENGAGERLTFARRVPGPSGDRLEGDTVVQPGAGPPMHVHYCQQEVFTVEHGRIGYQRPGEPEQFAGPGETIVFAAGEPHRFWNAGTTELRCSAYLEPAGNAEFLLTEIFESARRSGRGRPGLFDTAFLMMRYRSEFAMLEVPSAVQRWLFPLLVAVGTVSGKYRKFADAPEPVGR